MEPKGSLPHSPANAPCPCPKPEQSSPCLPIPLLQHQFYIILPSKPRSSKWSLSPTSIQIPPVSHMCHTPRPSHSSWFDHLNNIQCAEHIMKFLIMSSPLPQYLIPLTPKYLPQHPILQQPQPTFLPNCDTPSFKPTQNNRENCSSVYLNLYIFGQHTGWQKILHWMTGIIPTLQFPLNMELTFTKDVV